MTAPARQRSHLTRRWRDLPVRHKGLIVVALPMAALIATGAVFLVVDRQNRRANTAVERTLEVQNSLEDLMVVVLNAETGGRGFVLTGDQRFVEPLELARTRLPETLTRLRGLLGRDDAQTDRVDTVAELIDQRLALSERTIRFGPNDLGTAALLDVLDEGKTVTDQIRDQVAEIEAVEQRRLAQQRSDADTAQRRGIASIVVALLTGLTGGVVATALFSRGVSKRLADLQRDAELMADGQPVTATVDGHDEIGSLARSLATARDQLEQRDAELRARESELRAIFDASPDIILVFDVDGTIVSVNRAISTVLGYPEAERQGAAARDVIHPDDIDRFHEALHRAANGIDERINVRYRVRHADGSWIDIEARGQAINQETRPSHVLIVSRDIQAQVQVEAAQQRAKETAESANRAKSEFLSHMSHELRTPLNAVLGFAQVLELDELEPDQRDAVDHILKAGRHLLDLINEVLDLARIDSGEMALSPEPVHVGDLIVDAADLVAPLADEHGITINHDTSCDHHVLADRQRTKQVLLNLLSNAVKYNRHAGTITLRCRHDANHVRIDVADTGVGIAPEHQHLLFTPFERLAHHQTQIEGTGIGLALSRRLTEAMGGTLDLTETSNRGSTFTLELPIAEAPTDRHERLTTDHRLAPRPTPANHAPRTIVHVEDNLANVKLIERILQHRSDVSIVATMQGRLALDLIREHQPALVLLDLHLPDINGDDVLRQLVNDPTTSRIPVVILSADATQRQIQRLLAAGAHSYLTKPVDVRALTNTINTILDTTPPPRS